MTNYHFKPQQDNYLYSAWKEAKEKRKKVLDQVRARRREMYIKYLAKRKQTLSNI